MDTEIRDTRTSTRPWVVIDGNEAAARVAHRLSEVIAIYPITPSSADGRARRRVVGPRADEPVGRRARR